MEKIIFSDGTEFLCPTTVKAAVHPYPSDGRIWRRITVVASIEEAKTSFVDDIQYRHEWESEANGATEIRQEDLSEFCLAGDIVDHRDGTVTVYMGKPTELELTNAELDEAAAAMREGVNSLVVD